MSKFVVEFETDNASFTDEFATEEERDDDDARAHETSDILKRVASVVRHGNTEGYAYDSNGNKIGTWRFEE